MMTTIIITKRTLKSRRWWQWEWERPIVDGKACSALTGVEGRRLCHYIPLCHLCSITIYHWHTTCVPLLTTTATTTRQNCPVLRELWKVHGFQCKLHEVDIWELFSIEINLLIVKLESRLRVFPTWLFRGVGINQSARWSHFFPQSTFNLQSSVLHVQFNRKCSSASLACFYIGNFTLMKHLFLG